MTALTIRKTRIYWRWLTINPFDIHPPLVHYQKATEHQPAGLRIGRLTTHWWAAEVSDGE